jgi:nitroimidazol reductase NimA-like FMN-containing flavoprotein (pyridoxamine 5'-phosphate oxidase superfamily)
MSHLEMRRKDKEIMDIAEIKDIMEKATFCRIAMCDDNKPYVVSVNFGIDNNILYVHSAPEGRKIEVLKKNNNVCIEMDIDHEIEIAKRPCASTTKFRSVIAFGEASFINDMEKKREALNVILSHYSDEGPFAFRERQLNRMLVIKIELDEITGKKSGYQ